ncbi:hypothetical protein NRIC_37140 [Enterococcus florum]|uniref:Uncharacterized protein n=1 Tax=Enterococcus florum TaxID=2480627 RepID=A0A4P5PTJ9_9ENTE|nr:hypothetical protein NRIC_37140 [Enterococcus florum]
MIREIQRSIFVIYEQFFAIKITIIGYKKILQKLAFFVDQMQLSWYIMYCSQTEKRSLKKMKKDVDR